MKPICMAGVHGFETVFNVPLVIFRILVPAKKRFTSYFDGDVMTERCVALKSSTFLFSVLIGKALN